MADAPNAAAEPNWREEVYQALKELEIKQVHFVPDAGHSHVIDRCLADPAIEAGMLANEFESVGVCCGAWLGGQRAAMLMQSSGIGNITFVNETSGLGNVFQGFDRQVGNPLLLGK